MSDLPVLAAVFHGAGKPLDVRPQPTPALAGGETLVAIDCCTLCGSDLHTIRGDRPAPCPIILGHEALGRVIELCPDDSGGPCDVQGTPLVVGDRITWSIVVSCGQCRTCRRSIPQKCSQLRKFGHESTDRWPLGGGLAQCCRLPAGAAILKLPATLPDLVAGPANCATATVAACFRRAGQVRDLAVVIQGAGMLGLTAAAMARCLGAREVIIADKVADRLERAPQFGASQVIEVDPQQGDLQQKIHRATGGCGADLVLEMSGAPSAIDSSLPLLGVGGRLLLAGSVFPTPAISIDPEHVVRHLLRIEGVHNYAPSDLVEAIGFLDATQAKFPWSTLVESQFALQEVNAAVQHAMRKNPVRVAVIPAR